MKSEKAEIRKGRAPARLATQLLQMRLSGELLRVMEREHLTPRELEELLGEESGYAERALGGDLPVETLREVLRAAETAPDCSAAAPVSGQFSAPSSLAA